MDSFSSEKSSVDKEKFLLRSITAMEESLKNSDSIEKETIEKQLMELKKQLENIPEERQKEQLSGTTNLYRLLLERHSELINEKEQKTVGEIKRLVNGDDLTLISLKSSFVPENYDFEKHFFYSCERAFLFVRDEIELVQPELKISYWLTPKEMVRERIGDDEDKAVLLCGLMFGMGDKKAEVVIAELEDNSAHAFVISEFNGKFLLLDPSQNHKFREFFGDKTQILENYSFNGKNIRKFLFKFNSEKYERF